MTNRTRRVEVIPEAITRAAERDADHTALSLLGDALSYGDLEARANSFANMLLDHGVRRGDRIGLFSHKSIELLVALYGTMKAGAAYVPINPDAPPAYVAHIIEDCEITHLVVGASTRRTWAQVTRRTSLEVGIGLEDVDGVPRSMGWDEVWSYPDTEPDVAVSGGDLAYIIFTSGSTGRPKGIMHSHQSGLAYGEVATETYGFRPDDRIANHPPLNFDLSLLELWGGVLAGATVVIVPESHVRLPASLSQLLVDERVTVINAVPFALAQLLHRGALEQRDLTALRWVLFGGEVFPTKDLRALMRRLPDARFANVYGPAEVNGVTYHIVPDLPEDSDEPISIGKLYPGMEARVVDPAGHELGYGETGELLIHSPTRMLGYWRQAELTDRSTLRTVDADGREKHWHRTGDLVQRNPDGHFRLIGRKDRMVKTRGHRVELDEVESALISHEAVAEAVVFAVPDGEGSQQIEAVVTLHADGPTSEPPPTAADLQRHAGQQLPRYAVPRHLRIVATVPRTSTGKADRVRLSEQAHRGT